ncbi:hypothetical protein QBC46DRAFT_348093 [Diplogelasinospora grovesii]|uniref:Uncharacterized protein n=1 Tax=Diplogelasinospora grovesii TaxID=303347 RepID=A0AAN6RYM7_9PEZI|nr:hypothetical protein QBC46DRAFT_348093 [Diplogelasinospora grovesii]
MSTFASSTRAPAPAEVVPLGYYLLLSEKLGRMNVDFSQTLAGYSDTLRRLHDQQSETSFWRERYNRLYDDYANLDERFQDAAGRNLGMSVDIAKKDGIIEALEKKICGLETSLRTHGSLEAVSASGGWPGWLSAPASMGADDEDFEVLNPLNASV